MKHFGLVLVGLALAGCAGGHGGPPPDMPAVTSAADAEALVRRQLAGSQVDQVQVERKDAAWAASNLGVQVPAGDSAWVVVAHGQIHGTLENVVKADAPYTFLTANFVLASTTGESLKTYLGDRQPLAITSPTITAEDAERQVRYEMAGSRIDGATAELKTFKWVNDNLGQGQELYTPDSPAWVVTVSGQLQPPAMSGMVPMSNGKVAVAPDTCRIMAVDLYPGDFIPTAAPVLAAGPTSGTFLTAPEPSPHP